MADNYTALKSSQKKRYISKETFNSLDLSQIPVGSEYEVVSPIEKGDLSADINNALNKAEKSIPGPTNQTTGSDGDVLVKKGGGSEWKSSAAFTDQTNEFSQTQFVGKDDIGGTFFGTKITKDGVIVAGQNNTAANSGVVQIGQNGSGKDGYIAIANGGTISTNIDDDSGYQTTVKGDEIILAAENHINAIHLKFEGGTTPSTATFQNKTGKIALVDDIKVTPSNEGTVGQVLKKTADGSEWADVSGGSDPYTLPIATADKLGGVKSSTTGTTADRDYNVEVKNDGTMKVNVPWVEGGGTNVVANPGGGTENLITLTIGPKTYNIPDTGVTGVEVTGSGNAITDASISGRTITLTKGATYALTTDIPDTSNLSSFSVEVW